MRRLASILTGGALLLACGAKTEPRVVDAEGQALSRVALDVLAREACPRLLVRTFSLDDPKTHEATGKLWVHRCSARAAGRGGLDVDLDVLGWQWAGESSWGFAIGEYVYFTATIRARLDAEIDTSTGAASLRVFSAETPSVAVRAIGRVSARAETPASSILGLATGLVGNGPNDLATLRGSGVARIPARSCPWVLVTGPRGEANASVSLALAAAPPLSRHTGRRWVKPTLLSYELTRVTREQKLFALQLGTAADLRMLGRPLVAPQARAIDLVSRPMELREHAPLVVRMMSLRPLPPSSWWSGQARYEETELGRGAVVPTIDNGHEERDVILESNGALVGKARLALDVMEVE